MRFKGLRLLKNIVLTAITTCSSSLYAGTMGVAPPAGPWSSHPWLITASLGYTEYAHMYAKDGETPIGRLAIGREFTEFYNMMLGAEIGVQNGGNMRLNLSQTQLDTLGGLPVQLTIKPLLDLLFTFKTSIFSSSSAFFIGKGGVAFRQLANERNTINDLSQGSGELQIGLGYPISEITNLMLSYQGIYGGKPDYKINTADKTAHIANIPSQQGLLLSVSIVL